MSPHPDHKLILALRAGDFSVLDAVYRDHAAAITSWVTKNSGDLADAQDVFQESIVALHQKANDADFVLTCPLGALLFLICRNKWLYQLRKKNRERQVRSLTIPQSEGEGNVHELLEAVEEENLRQQRMRAAFAKLSELCQRLLKLLATGMSGADIAQKLEMQSAGTVYRRRHACGTRWRSLYEVKTRVS